MEPMLSGGTQQITISKETFEAAKRHQRQNKHRKNQRLQFYEVGALFEREQS